MRAFSDGLLFSMVIFASPDLLWDLREEFLTLHHPAANKLYQGVFHANAWTLPFPTTFRAVSGKRAPDGHKSDATEDQEETGRPSDVH
ncbi:hypothetical protein WAI453_003813 [Rhynchosporium graminicola]